MTSKILHIVCETGSLSGGVRVIGELANRLVARGWKVSIWSVNPRETMKWFSLSSLVEWNSFYRTGTTADYDQLADVLKKQTGFKLATFWRTAFAVEHAAAEGEGLYLVQDIETSYTSQPLMAAQVMRTYAMGFRHLTTSKWVKSQMDCEYIGIGIDNYWKRLDKVKREKWPLACARAQALKGWPELCEAARYLDRQNYFLHTYGMNKHTMVARHEHHHPGGPMADKELRALYNQAGVFLSTSRHEGFSLTPLEASLCFPGETRVLAKDILGGQARRYSGVMIRIRTKSGTISSTPEHPFFTDIGWVPAKLLTTERSVWYNTRYENSNDAYSVKLGRIDQVARNVSGVFGARNISGSWKNSQPSSLGGQDTWVTEDNRAEDRPEALYSVRERSGLSGRYHRWGGDCHHQEIDSQVEADHYYSEQRLTAHGLAQREVSEAGAILQGEVERSRELCFYDTGVILPASVQGSPTLFGDQEAENDSPDRVDRVAPSAADSRQVDSLDGGNHPDLEGFEPQPIEEVDYQIVSNLAVYNLTTASHIYIANGFLVHNCGCPVVMTPADGNLEYLVDGENCLLATTPLEVAQKAMQILEDRPLGERLAKALEKRAQEYRWPEVISKLETILLGPT